MISSRVVLLATLVAHAICREPFVQLEEDSVLQVERAEFHAYENAWSVGFSHAPDVHAFDVLVFEVCRPPCEDGGDGGGEALVYPCAALARGFAQRGWRNEYMWARANESRELCADLHAAASGSSVLQGQAALVLSDAEGLPLVRVRAPLTLVLYNDDELARWASGKGADLLSVTVRVSYITALQSAFAMRRSVLRIELRRPVRSVLSFSVQNPCTALGLSAPESGHVMLVNVSGRPQCAWFCRGDRIKVPYNSAPPTRAQVNVSTQEYAALAVKYKCLQPPEEWTASVFELTLETQMVDGELAQSFFDLLDRVAAEVQQRLLGDGEGVVLLSVVSDLHHPLPFAEWVRRLQDAQCLAEDSTCGALREVKNPTFVYARRRARRRLLAHEIRNIELEGVLIAPQESVVDAELRPQPQSVETLERVQQLRESLPSVLADLVNEIAEEDSSFLLVGVSDVDVQIVITVAVQQKEDLGEQSVRRMLLNAAMVGAVLSGLAVLAFVLVCSTLRLLPAL